MHTIEQFLPSPLPFLDKIFLQLKMKGLFVLSFELDHICYRVETEERYQKLKIQLSTIAKLLKENEINGRKITVFKLEEPICHETREIYLIELPAPKKGSFYVEGYEHAEFVIDTKLDDFIAAHPYIDFDEKGFSKDINRDVRLSLGNESVKFHEQSLEIIIEKEH